MKRKQFRWFFITAAGLIILLMLGSVAKQIKTEHETAADYIIFQTASPNGTHTVSIIGNGQPTWPFGTQQVSVHFDDNAHYLTTMIGNDGAEAVVKNVDWISDDTLRFELSGRNTPAISYEVSFKHNEIGISFSTVETETG